MNALLVTFAELLYRIPRFRGISEFVLAMLWYDRPTQHGYKFHHPVRQSRHPKP